MRQLPRPGMSLLFVIGALGFASGFGGCGSGGAVSQTDQAFLSEVHATAADIGQFRSDAQLVRLGHAVCDDFAAGASYQEVADRLAIDAGSSTLPTADLGAVITSAADQYCPKYRGYVS